MTITEYFESKGVKIDAWWHPASTKRNPIWYGRVGGWEVTAPCFSAEHAVRSAKSNLEGNGAWAAWSTHASLPPDPDDADRTAHIARAKELLALLEEARAQAQEPAPAGISEQAIRDFYGETDGSEDNRTQVRN